jgi:hypothetical protein
MRHSGGWCTESTWITCPLSTSLLTSDLTKGILSRALLLFFSLYVFVASLTDIFTGILYPCRRIFSTQISLSNVYFQNLTKAGSWTMPSALPRKPESGRGVWPAAARPGKGFFSAGGAEKLLNPPIHGSSARERVYSTVALASTSTAAVGRTTSMWATGAAPAGSTAVLPTWPSVDATNVRISLCGGRIRALNSTATGGVSGKYFS